MPKYQVTCTVIIEVEGTRGSWAVRRCSSILDDALAEAVDKDEIDSGKITNMSFLTFLMEGKGRHITGDLPKK